MTVALRRRLERAFVERLRALRKPVRNASRSPWSTGLAGCDLADALVPEKDRELAETEQPILEVTIQRT